MGTAALVTGANGFVGSHLVELLQDRGGEAYAMVRRTSNVDNLKGRNVEFRYADVTDTDSLRQAMEGIEIVYHVAGATAGWTEDDFDRVNQKGTQNVFEAARTAKNGPRRVVLMSSLAAAGPCSAEAGRREYHSPDQITPYGRSKFRGEQAAFQAAQSGDIEVVIVRPPTVYGPRDTEVLQLIQAANWGLIATQGFRPLWMSVVHPHDLCRGTVLAAERGEPLPREPQGHVLGGGGVAFPEIDADHAHAAGKGIYYFHDGGRCTLEGFGRAAAEALGKRAVRLALPKPVVWVGAWFNELGGRIKGKAPVFSRHKVLEASQPGWMCEIDKAREELGYTPEMPLAEGMEQTVRWLRDHSVI
jgi:nucleoside-diphosphate-sugar epimerase